MTELNPIQEVPKIIIDPKKAAKLKKIGQNQTMDLETQFFKKLKSDAKAVTKAICKE